MRWEFLIFGKHVEIMLSVFSIGLIKFERGGMQFLFGKK